MAITFPTTLDSFSNPSASDTLAAPASHAGMHSDVFDAIEALEAKLGITDSAVTTSIDYLISLVVSTTQSGATYTLALTDARSLIACSNASTPTITIPTNASVAFPTGTRVLLLATGALGLTLSTTGITLLGSAPYVTVAQNEALFLEKTATDTWAVIGGTS